MPPGYLAEETDAQPAAPIVADQEGLEELREIRMRLDAIEHATEVLVRAQESQIWPPLEKLFKDDRLLAEIYLLIDGEVSQREIVASLRAKGITVDEPRVSRGIRSLRDASLVQLVERNSKGNIYTTVRLEKILHLKKRVARLIEPSKTKE